jgi:hypothetical protein
MYRISELEEALKCTYPNSVSPETQKGDSITFSTPTIEGTIMRRNKLDDNDRHPWKAEVTEGDTGVDASTISGWFSAVYEPDFTGSGNAGGSV